MSTTLDNKQRAGFPVYPSIIPGALRAIANRLLGKRMRMGPFAQQLVERVSPPVVCLGAHNIPPDGGYLVTVNHYAREGFSSAWIALAVSGVLPHEVTWVMTQEWVFQGNPMAFILRPAMRIVLRSFHAVFGFLPMPPIIPGYSEVAERSAAVRRVIDYARAHPSGVIGIAPEGRDTHQTGMGEMPNGVGKFILYLNRVGLRILPTLVSEEDGKLYVRFGEPYDLTLTDAGSDLDAQARAIVRGKINELLGN